MFLERWAATWKAFRAPLRSPRIHQLRALAGDKNIDAGSQEPQEGGAILRWQRHSQDRSQPCRQLPTYLRRVTVAGASRKGEHSTTSGRKMGTGITGGAMVLDSITAICTGRVRVE
jgi:hypothetical protein